MRAYIHLTPEVLRYSLENVHIMTAFLSFDLLEHLQKKTSKNGDLILYQDLPMRCEYCNVKGDDVVYHHYHGRRYKHLEHHFLNRIPLCHKHHNGDSEFSAHLTPRKFDEWITDKRGEEWLETLREAKFKIKGDDNE